MTNAMVVVVVVLVLPWLLSLSEVATDTLAQTVRYKIHHHQLLLDELDNPVHCSVDCEEENVRKLVHNAASNVSAPSRERQGRAMY